MWGFVEQALDLDNREKEKITSTARLFHGRVFLSPFPFAGRYALCDCNWPGELERVTGLTIPLPLTLFRTRSAVSNL
jgi:hypothetical protein